MTNNTSIATLLPHLKASTERDNLKLTARQLRVASIIKGERHSLAGVGPNNLSIATLNQDQSAISFRSNKYGGSDNLQSRAFVTSNTPNRERRQSSLMSPQPSIGFAENSHSNLLQGQKTEKRKIFGAEAYLERQQKLGLRNMSMDLPNSQTL